MFLQGLLHMQEAEELPSNMCFQYTDSSVLSYMDLCDCQHKTVPHFTHSTCCRCVIKPCSSCPMFAKDLYAVPSILHLLHQHETRA